jgi:uncharacterized protein (DUF4415 family)
VRSTIHLRDVIPAERSESRDPSSKCLDGSVRTLALRTDADASIGRDDSLGESMASKHGKRIVTDNDVPEVTDADFAAAKPLKMPEVVGKRGRGRPKVENPKERVSLRLDPKIVAAYKATGEGWQSRINDVLARALSQQKTKRRPSRTA